MKVLIIGSDGYIGWTLMNHLLEKGHEVTGFDNLSRRNRVNEIGSDSLTIIDSHSDRCKMLDKVHSNSFNGIVRMTLGKADPHYIRQTLRTIRPDAIVHLGEMPSAPWSMIDPYKAAITQQENVIGTLHLLWAMKEECPNAHLVKLGTMGEYGTPNCRIPEGEIPEECIANVPGYAIHCPMRGLLFPRTPGSFYHISKVHDTYNVEFACRNWGLRSTDIMQGVVFGLDKDITTRFDYDEYFGTAINRFCAQAIIGHPLTVYGKGGQTRGFLTLSDSIQCFNSRQRS